MRIHRGWRRAFAVVMIAFVLFSSVVAVPVARANPLVIAAGGVEVGTLALWGAAALVAGAGLAVGAMSPEAAQSMYQWGEDVWNGANDAIKAGITAASAVAAQAWGTSSRVAITWPQDVRDYLIAQLGGLYVSVDSGRITAVGHLDQILGYPSYATAPAGKDLFIIPERYYPKHITALRWNSPSDVTMYGYDSAVGQTQWGNFAGYHFNNLVDFWLNFVLTTGVAQEGYQIVSNPVYQWDRPDVKVPDVSAIPGTMTLPAPHGMVNEDGTVASYDTPVVGRLADGTVAVGFPASGVLTQEDAVTSVPYTTDQSVPGSLEGLVADVVGTVSGIRTAVMDFVDVSKPIDWSPLQAVGTVVTTRFPFSLPWDIQRGVQGLQASATKPDISGPVVVAGMSVPVNLTWPEWVDTLVAVVRGGIILLFTAGLIFAHSRLMGGSR